MLGECLANTGLRAVHLLGDHAEAVAGAVGIDDVLLQLGLHVPGRSGAGAGGATERRQWTLGGPRRVGHTVSFAAVIRCGPGRAAVLAPFVGWNLQCARARARARADDNRVSTRTGEPLTAAETSVVAEQVHRDSVAWIVDQAAGLADVLAARAGSPSSTWADRIEMRTRVTPSVVAFIEAEDYASDAAACATAFVAIGQSCPEDPAHQY